MSPEPSPEFCIARTRAWVERAVIGLNLCPFAKAPQIKGLVRYVVCQGRETRALLETLLEELGNLAQTAPDRVETTLLIHPWVMNDFADYNDFLETAEAAVEELGLAGVLQVASFHPDYQFADSAPDDIANATNRSPYPTLHLLREDSITRAVEAFPDAEAIYGANMATLEQLGARGWEALQRQCLDDALGAAGAAPPPH